MAHSERIEAEYVLSRVAPGPQARGLARRIAFEQTVELPESVVTDRFVVENVLGRVESVSGGGPDDGSVRARVSYHASLADTDLSALLNLVFGNVSLYPGVRLAAISLPDPVLALYRGPRLGVNGLRERLGVYARPLLATALKPRGLPLERLASMSSEFALGGGDIVKDDQNLGGDLEHFWQRAEACRNAVDEANQRTGRRCLYFPHVSGPLPALERRFELARTLGLEGVLVCPMLLGLDTARTLAERYELAIMAHPALAGSLVVDPSHGIAPEVLLGTFLRLAGADISVFPSDRGRFAFSAETCRRIRMRLGEPLGHLAPGWPAPAGGMQQADLEAIARAHGPDSVLLVGGALQAHPEGLRYATEAFLDTIRGVFPGQTTPVAVPELPPRATVLRFRPDYTWQSRPSSEYKSDDDPRFGNAFRDVKRVELVGQHGERTGSDLRYFEVGPGGFTSRERHIHSHIIVGARGEGVLVLGERRTALGANDVAHVGALTAHQLVNERDEPFGFFCMADHDRDRPVPA